MQRFFRRGMIPLLLLLLAGCYQQAGESFQPASRTEIPGNVPEATGEALDLTVFPATATLPPITIIAVTRAPLAVATTETEPPAPEATAFELPTTDSALLIPATATAVGPPTQNVFITPFSPLGPVTPILPTPTTGLLNLATATPSGLITPTAFVEGGNECTYTVRSGDNLFRIATNNNVSLAELRQANPDLVGDLLQPGQLLQLPGCVLGGAADAVIAPDTPTDVPAVVAPVDGTTYVVQPGDTLFNIARRFNTTVAAIVQANNLASPDRLNVGQQLVIPAPAS